MRGFTHFCGPLQHQDDPPSLKKKVLFLSFSAAWSGSWGIKPIRRCFFFNFSNISIRYYNVNSSRLRLRMCAIPAIVIHRVAQQAQTAALVSMLPVRGCKELHALYNLGSSSNGRYLLPATTEHFFLHFAGSLNWQVWVPYQSRGSRTEEQALICRWSATRESVPADSGVAPQPQLQPFFAAASSAIPKGLYSVKGLRPPPFSFYSCRPLTCNRVVWNAHEQTETERKESDVAQRSLTNAFFPEAGFPP